MNFLKTYLLLLFLSSANTIHAQPEATIQNDSLKVTLHLPDTAKGYYRGSRFDWSGVISSLNYKGHEYFGVWFEKYSPTLHDAITGPVDAFAPVGYDSAKTGERFLIIGAGTLIKPDEPRYFFANNYVFSNYGQWKIKIKKNAATFIHSLYDGDFRYQYTKTVSLLSHQPILEINYELKNTSKKTIDTREYNHNFFTIDHEITSQDLVIRFPYTLNGEVDNQADFGRLEDHKIVFTRPFTNNDHIQFRNLTGYGNTAKDYDIIIENQKTKAGVQIQGDQPLAKQAFWSAIKTVCPEPFIRIYLKPGQTMNWKLRYRFYEK